MPITFLRKTFHQLEPDTGKAKPRPPLPPEPTQEEARQKLHKMFTGGTLDPYIEANMVKLLTSFTPSPKEKVTFRPVWPPTAPRTARPKVTAIDWVTPGTILITFPSGVKVPKEIDEKCNRMEGGDRDWFCKEEDINLLKSLGFDVELRGSLKSSKAFGELSKGYETRNVCVCAGAEIAGYAESIKHAVQREWWYEAKTMAENMETYVANLKQNFGVDVTKEYHKLLQAVLRRGRNDAIEAAAGVSLALCNIRGPFQFTEEQLKRAAELTKKLLEDRQSFIEALARLEQVEPGAL